MDSTLTPGHPEPFESQGARAAKRYVNGNLVERGRREMSLELNSCFLIDYRLWAAKSEGRQWVEHCIEQCIEHPPEPRSGLCPEWLADFRIPNLLGARRGAEGSFLCSLITDFLAEGAGWGASPGRGGELGCQAQQVLKKFVRLASAFPSPPTRSLSNRKGRGRRSGT